MLFIVPPGVLVVGSGRRPAAWTRRTLPGRRAFRCTSSRSGHAAKPVAHARLGPWWSDSASEDIRFASTDWKVVAVSSSHDKPKRLGRQGLQAPHAPDAPPRGAEKFHVGAFCSHSGPASRERHAQRRPEKRWHWGSIEASPRRRQGLQTSSQARPDVRARLWLFARLPLAADAPPGECRPCSVPGQPLCWPKAQGGTACSRAR